MRLLAGRRARAFGALLLALLLVVGAPAGAIDFAAQQLIYSEIVDGETAYPTTPELDEIAAGGLVPFFLAMQPPALTGSVARVTLTGSGEQGGHQLDASGIGTASFGVSGSFGDLGVPVGAVVSTDVGAFFDPPHGITLSANLVLPAEGSGLQAFLSLLEFDLDAPISQEQRLFLPDVVPDTLRAEPSSHQIRLFVDRDAGRAHAALEVPGLGVFEAPPLDLVGLEGIGVDVIGHGATLLPTSPPAAVNVDLKPIAVYSGVAEFAPLFNVDVGAFVGTPSSAYAAAGSAGSWNTIGLGTTALTTVAGGASSASATLVTDSDLGFGPGSPPDAQALMGDFGVDCADDAWSLSFAGLPVGLYRLFVYAPSAPGASTGTMDVPQGEILAELAGDVGAALLPGVSYVRTTAVVTDGSLDLSGLGTGAIECAGIAGVQLERQRLVAPVPALTLGGAVLLVASILGAARGAQGRRVVTRRRSFQ